MLTYLLVLSSVLHVNMLSVNILFSLSLQDEQLLEDSKSLGDCGFTNQTARPQAPGTVGLAFRITGQ